MGEERARHLLLLDEKRGRFVELVDPDLVTDPELRPAPPHVLFLERRLAGVTQYVRMRATSPT